MKTYYKGSSRVSRRAPLMVTIRALLRVSSKVPLRFKKSPASGLRQSDRNRCGYRRLQRQRLNCARKRPSLSGAGFTSRASSACSPLETDRGF